MISRIGFMATTSDLINLMLAVEAQISLKYTLTGFPDEPILKQADSFSRIEGFGVSKRGRLIVDDCFLVSKPDLKILTEPVPQNKGGIKYFISTPLNPKTVGFSPGGLFGGGNFIISGELRKYSDEPEAKEMFKSFQREIKRQFKRHKECAYWLGSEAAVMHLAGARLTDDVDSRFSLPIEMNPARQ
jgi:hypothetical protein